MKLNYGQLTYIIEALREARCKAYDSWINKKFEYEQAQDGCNESHQATKLGDGLDSAVSSVDLKFEYEQARDAYYMADEVYRNFVEGEIEI